MRDNFLRALLLSTVLGLFAAPAWAANEGQADLDKATDARLEADTLADFEGVAALCESALKKGLDDENTKFANELLSSVLMQHAQKVSAAIFEQNPPDRRWPIIRQVAMKDLERALKADPKLVDAHLLIAKLQVLPQGNIKLARQSADEAIKLLAEDKPAQAKAYVLRAQISDNPEEQLADFDKALAADPKCVEALQIRAMLRLVKKDYENAVGDLLKLLELDASNLVAQEAITDALTNLKQYDEALKHVDKLIELNPGKTQGFLLRARVRLMQEKLEEGLEDLNQVLKLDPRNLGALLLRARVLAGLDKFDEAKADVEKALKVEPELAQAIELRSVLAAQAKNYAEAIADIRTLLQADPQNNEYRLQLGAYYAADSRPRKAIEIFDQIVDSEPDNWEALRARADALLSIGEHAKAIEDYEAALKLKSDDSHMLNNLAWVLATSEDDSIRNAKRSVEVGTKACEVTKFEAPHILSTLAAGYAESGDWDNAVKWSGKAVELSEKAEKRGEDVSEQLKKELESYKQKKPWREKQKVEENKKPLKEKKPDLEA